MKPTDHLVLNRQCVLLLQAGVQCFLVSDHLLINADVTKPHGGECKHNLQLPTLEIYMSLTVGFKKKNTVNLIYSISAKTTRCHHALG